MAEDHSRLRQTVPYQAQGPGANATTPAPKDGGASSSAQRSALSSDPVLTGLQDAFSIMSSNIDQTPRDFFPSSSDSFSDFPAFDPYSFDSLQGGSQYNFPSPATAVNPRYLDSSAELVEGVSSHQANPDPWTHMDVTGPSSVLPDTMNPDQAGISSTHLKTPTQPHRPSSASGHNTFADSAYATGSRKSQHPSDLESIGERQRHMNNTPTPVTPTQASSHSSTVTPTAPYSFNPPLPEDQSSTHRSHRRQSELHCGDCKYLAKTRSDLKKHSARHRRDFKCTYQDCPQSKRGFATVNDLDRHMKAVHKVNNRKTKSFKCFGEGCTKAEKDWPRLDNFKQHLRKMHSEEPIEQLLKLSNEWFEQQTHLQPADETASVASSIHRFPTSSVMSVPEQFAAFRGSFVPSSPSYTSGPSRGSEMTRPSSHGASAIDPSLAGMLDTTPPTACHNQRRSISGPVNARNFRQQSGPTFFNTSNLVPSQPPMHRARSQADYSAYQNPAQIQNSFTNQSINYHFTPPTAFDPNFASMRAPCTFAQAPDNQQPRKVKKARTIAGIDLHSNRVRDFPSLQEVQTIPQDFRNNPEDFAGFETNLTADTAPTSSPHQSYEVNIFQPQESSPKTRFQERIEDVIHTFLDEHKSKAGSQSLSEDDFLNRIRLSLGNSDSITSGGASSVGPACGRADGKASGSIHCPVTKEDYFVCPVCQKPKKRQSDLNKHMQRHSKPYGCVFDGCQKVFGSKNDWKRHEQTQHEQQECWRCHLCLEVFFHDQNHYTLHMSEVHSTQHPQESARQNRIARNYQGRFWCGFCSQIITHTKTDVEAINVRFDHIANHFTKYNKASKDWVELVGKGKTKQQIHDEQSQTTEAGEQDVVSGSQTTSASTQSLSSPQSDSSPLQRTFSQHSASSDGVQSAMSNMQDMHSMMTAQGSTTPMPGLIYSQTRHTGSQGRRPDPRTSTKLVFCCECGDGPIMILSPVCISCNHRFCLSCSLEETSFDES